MPPVRRGHDFGKRQPDQPLSAAECLLTQDRAIVLGHPGSGKTTLLRFLAHRWANRDDEEADLSIYVRLPELSRAPQVDERIDVVKFVAARAADRGCPDVEEQLRDELDSQRRRCVVLLDGLDEVGNDEQRRRLIGSVLALIDRYPSNRFIITSRIVGFENAPWREMGFAVYRILDYGQEQLRQFAKTWAKILSPVEKQPASEIEETLKTAIFQTTRVRVLASNPLILTILVLLNDARGGALPRRRVDLYEKVVEVFLDTWESSKRRTGMLDAAHGIELDACEFRWLLSDLSLAMQKAGLTLAARWWLADQMQEYLQQKLGFDSVEAKDACDRMLRYLTERTGLIEERGPDLFGFVHRTLQEYFASLGVMDEAGASQPRHVTDCLRGYYFHPLWCEVVRLTAAQLTPPVAQSLVASIVDDPDPVGRFLKRGQMLALRCLSDGTTVPDRRWISRLFDSLVELGKSRWFAITSDAIDVLESFEGTRLESLANKSVSGILATAKSELDNDE